MTTNGRVQVTKAVLITNTASGSHLEGAEDEGVVRGWLEDGGIDVTALGGSVSEQIAASLESKADIVVVDGGDGTINAVIGAHVGSGRPVGIIPGGTMNLLATDYGLPLDREAAARAIAHLNVRSFDAGRLGEHVFLHTALTGLPARLGVHREHLRGRLGLVDRIGLGLHAIGTVGRDPRLTLQIDEGEADEERLTSATFAFFVGAVHGAILPRPQREADGSGSLTGFAIDTRNGLDLARVVVRGAFGELDADPMVSRRVLRAGHVEGKRRSTHAMLDGEGVRLALPAPLTVLPGAVSVIVPPPEAGRSPATGDARNEDRSELRV